MQDISVTTPETPTRAIRVPVPNRTEPNGISPTPAPPPTTNARLNYNNSCCKCIQQSNNLTSSLAVRQTQGLQTTSLPHLSREYWTQPIDKSVKYPGEDVSQNAKTDYLQRLDSYISKSTLIWDLISGTSTCPITSDPQSIVALKVTFDEI